MGIEIDAKYGGAGSTFFSSILAIEELARVDPSVSVVCDVQNTLISEYFREYSSQELKDKYLPRLAKDLVCTSTMWLYWASRVYEEIICLWWSDFVFVYYSWEHSACLSLSQGVTLLPLNVLARRMVVTGCSPGRRCGSLMLNMLDCSLSTPTVTLARWVGLWLANVIDEIETPRYYSICCWQRYAWFDFGEERRQGKTSSVNLLTSSLSLSHPSFFFFSWV